MITIFNGRKRTLGLDSEKVVWAQVSVQFRDYLKLFKGAKLAVFLAIALHADEDGWAWPSRKLLCAETGLGPDTVSSALTALCNTSIDGYRVLLKGQPRMAKGGTFANNSYLIFPTPEEVQRFAQVKTIKQARKARGASPKADDPPCRENADTVAPCMPFPNTDLPYTVNPPQSRTKPKQNQSKEESPLDSSPVVVVRAAAANKAAKDRSPELLKEAHELLRDFYGVTYKASRNKIIKNLAARPDLMLRVIRQYGDEIQANHRLDEHYNCAGALVRVLCDLDMGMFVPK
jgi:helix-turn-helix protein